MKSPVIRVVLAVSLLIKAVSDLLNAVRRQDKTNSPCTDDASTCTRCGRTNRKIALYCWLCGAALDECEGNQ